jgi:hypothetical protein
MGSFQVGPIHLKSWLKKAANCSTSPSRWTAELKKTSRFHHLAGTHRSKEATAKSFSREVHNTTPVILMNTKPLPQMHRSSNSRSIFHIIMRCNQSKGRKRYPSSTLSRLRLLHNQSWKRVSQLL